MEWTKKKLEQREWIKSLDKKSAKPFKTLKVSKIRTGSQFEPDKSFWYTLKDVQQHSGPTASNGEMIVRDQNIKSCCKPDSDEGIKTFLRSFGGR